MIHLSSTALQELRRLQAKQGPAAAVLHLSVQPSQCLQKAYALRFAAQPHPSDVMSEHSGVTIALDAESLPYLNGLTIDYSEDLMGGGFRYHNPNASQHCECGNSFAIAPS